MGDGADDGLFDPNWGPVNDEALSKPELRSSIVLLYYTICLEQNRISVGGRIREENSVEENSERNRRRGRGEGRKKWEFNSVRNLQIFQSSVPKFALGL